MTDRELLELAAKAAGIEGRLMTKADGDLWLFRDDFCDPWNPLTNDGDALRLLVQLSIDLEWWRDGRVAAYKQVTSHGHWFTAFESGREDQSAAARRAIVRVAAEIGGSKP